MLSLLTLNGEALCVPLLCCFADQSSTHNADHMVLSFKVQAVELQHIKPQVSQCNFIYFLSHFLQKTIMIHPPMTVFIADLKEISMSATTKFSQDRLFFQGCIFCQNLGQKIGVKRLKEFQAQTVFIC